MEFNQFINIVTNTGFPIALCAYLLFRLEKQLTLLTSVVNKLNLIISAKVGMVIDPCDENDNYKNKM
mgnify:CR=1 FL=1